MDELLRRRTQMAAGSSRVPTIDDYVQDGILFWLDAIENTRDGHNASSTKWHDLAGNRDVTYAENAVIADKYCIPNGSASGTRVAVTTANTIELVFELVSSGGSQMILPWKGNSYGTVWIGSSGKLFFSAGRNDGTKGLAVAGGRNTCAARGLSAMFINGEEAEIVSTSATWSGTYDRLFYYNASYPAACTSKICAIRIYDRLLTDAEIAHNAAVDAARFGGGA